MFVSGSTDDPRSSPNNPLECEEGIFVPVPDSLGVRRRLGEMGRAMDLPAARPYGDRGPMGGSPPASAAALAAIVGAGISLLEENRSMAQSGRCPREYASGTRECADDRR